MAKSKQRSVSYYAAGKEHAKSLNACFRLNVGKRRYSNTGRWLGSGAYLRGLADGIKEQLALKDPARTSAVLNYVSWLPSTVRRYVIVKARIKVDCDGTPYVKHKGVELYGRYGCIDVERPTFWDRFKNLLGF